MTLYEKLAEARKRFKALGIRKGGRNDFQKYSYFELNDILKAVTDINADVKLCTVENMDSEKATLRVVDSEVPESFCEFSVPMSTANLKGCHPVQSLGAVITYLRRYLYQNAYSVAEPDQIDCLDQDEYEPEPTRDHGQKGLVSETARLTRQANFVSSVKAIPNWQERLRAFGYSEPSDVPEKDYRNIYIAMMEGGKNGNT